MSIPNHTTAIFEVFLTLHTLRTHLVLALIQVTMNITHNEACGCKKVSNKQRTQFTLIDTTKCYFNMQSVKVPDLLNLSSMQNKILSILENDTPKEETYDFQERKTRKKRRKRK